jgi:hypothetical protein
MNLRLQIGNKEEWWQSGLTGTIEINGRYCDTKFAWDLWQRCDISKDTLVKGNSYLLWGFYCLIFSLTHYAQRCVVRTGQADNFCLYFVACLNYLLLYHFLVVMTPCSRVVLSRLCLWKYWERHDKVICLSEFEPGTARIRDGTAAVSIWRL